MKTGMLWFDNSDALLSVKIQKAVNYYQKKYGKIPNLCLVHPSMVEESERPSLQLGDLKVRSFRPVLPGHIWIGIEDS